MKNTTSSILLVTCALAACNNPPAAQDDAAKASSTPSDTAATATSSPAADVEADKATITAEIARVIASYRTGKASDFVHSPDLDRVWNRALGTNHMDFDPLCACQDFEASSFRHRMKSVEIDGNHATAKFDLDPGWGDWQATRLTFVKTRGDWLLDDIGTPNMASLKNDMARAAPGSYGIPVE